MRDELIRRLEELGPRTAVIEEDIPFTNSDLLNQIRQIEEILRSHQVRPHDVVILNGDFSFQSIAALLALVLNRNIVVPIVTLTEGSLNTVAECCVPKHIIKVNKDLEVEGLVGPARANPGFYDRLVEEEASGLVLLSSGSTGAPKAILHDLDSIVREKLGKRTRKGTSSLNILMFLLFDHIGGINSMFSTLLVGGTAILPSRRTPGEICALIEKYEIRVLPTSPTFLNLILMGNYHHKHDLSSLRLITYGTEPMPEELLNRVNGAFPGVRLLQTFGTSETGISTTTSESSNSTYFKFTDSNVQYRIVDGELQLKSTTQFLGYLNYPSDSLTEDLWFKTGDLVEENADGYIKVKGRSKEIINVGGEKVLPLELEATLLASPLIEDCLVYGKSNAITGQSVCVNIKPRGDLSRAEVRKHVLEFLSDKVEPFKMPSKINVVDTIEISERFKKRRIQP